MKTPQEVYIKSERKWSGPLDQLSYPGMATRKVNSRGRIGIDGNEVFITTALKGWNVGLKPGSGRLWEVYFARLLIGTIEPNTAAFIPSNAGSQSPERQEAA